MRCPKCGYEWVPRVTKPKMCPNCKRYFIYGVNKSKFTKHKQIFQGYNNNNVAYEITQVGNTFELYSHSAFKGSFSTINEAHKEAEKINNNCVGDD